jgi:hypothetical protein
LLSTLLNKYYSGDQIKEDEIGWACSTYRERYIKIFGGET